MNWLIFWMALLAPTVLTLLLAKTGKAEEADSAVVVFFGSGLSAIICGYLMAGKFASSVVDRLLVAIALAVGFYILSVVLCFAGCVMGSTL